MTDVRSADPAVAEPPPPGAGPEAGRTGRGAGLRAGAGAALPAVGILVALAAWWLIARLELVHPFALPPPGDVLSAFVDKPARMLEHTWDTTLEILIGFALSVVAGVLIGLSLASSRTVERMFTPLLVAVNAVPKITLGPLLVVALGWGQKPILTMVFLLCFFPIVLSTATGLTTTPADLAELVRSWNASRWQAFRKVRFPAALPQIFVGLKVAMPLAAIGAVIGEFQAGESGLGYVITQYAGIGDAATAWAAIMLVALVSILLYSALLLIERFALPWVRETTSSR
ncbi:ABC transporter permease [Micromonospora noduli]|uniref:ABC transporter permease protein n=1 Tax=Micromonospora noduli TaxID=709876 RepID=A0A328N704_9ACTN|nr:ABC transporter permease [Micromonospora noduli]KAB1921809.1 ABC transporter permease [Micromonospora noduli]RAN99690.1 putative ABC transporter permease protein [Micromonospora noduli]RAO11137.1 putative ABC transporter permease protein [Micromonospora noduli]RAO11497.1 putative ABC transporter permease protein [Micromonospora noduli]RAO12598.1 putative ABC transporter permease protein [Micromonospora noduli]